MECSKCLFVWTMACLVAWVSAEEVCQLKLGQNTSTESVNYLFKTYTLTAYQVYFHLKEVSQEGEVLPLDLVGDDTFSPDLWVWATREGKNLLRLPIDHKILSLGLLTLKTANIDIFLNEESADCLKRLPYPSAANQLAKYFYQNITGNGTLNTQGESVGVVCRSVYAFEHIFYDKRGIGFECCSPGEFYVCEQSYSREFQFVWYGPIVLMCLIYLIGVGHCYKLYNRSFEKSEVKKLRGVVKSLTEIKADIVRRIISHTERLIYLQEVEDLIAMREKIRFLDIIGVGKMEQRKILRVVRVLVAVVFFLMYYVIWGLFLHAYNSDLSDEIGRMNDSKTVYLNVVGHIGWVYSSDSLGIHKYAIFECVYTALIPPMLLYLYFALQTRKKSKVGPSKVKCLQREFCRTFSCHSVQGMVLQYVCAFLLLLHFACLGGVFLAYVTYMVGLGLISNIDLLSPWVIPILLCLHFFANSFNPAFEMYNHIKDQLFALCIEDFKALHIRQNRESFLPRDLVEKYYISSSRSIIYSCVIRVLLAITALMLLTLVVLTLQYPYNSKLTALAPFLGVQVVLVLPYLAKTLSAGSPHQLEGVLLKQALKEYVSKYMEERPEIAQIQEEEDTQFDPVVPI